MDLLSLYAQYPFWIWLGFGGVLLGLELATGSGWLLWPAVTAAVMALIASFLPGGPAVHLIVYAVITIVATVAARRYLPRISGSGPDINDTMGRMIGLRGEAASVFADGRGRVHVDGKEWDAMSDDALIPGKSVQVTEMVSAASLRVKAA